MFFFEITSKFRIDVDFAGRIGVRVNPVVGGGKVAILSTAGKTSKFGLLMVDEFEAKILELYKNYPFSNLRICHEEGGVITNFCRWKKHSSVL